MFHVYAERFWIWLAWSLPRRLVARAFCRVVAHATTGKYGSTVLPELTVTEALRRFNLPS